jgi:hypothetical protein
MTTRNPDRSPRGSEDLNEASGGGVARRSILAAGAGAVAGAFAAYSTVDGDARSPAPPRAPGTTGAVTDWGAVPNGTYDSTEAINNALSQGGLVSLPFTGRGIYFVSGTLFVQQAGTQIEIETGVTLRAGSSAPVLVNPGYSDFSLDGHGSVIDLNGRSDRGLHVHGDAEGGKSPENIAISNIRIRNRPEQSEASSAIEIRNASRVSLNRIHVEDYGNKISEPKSLQTYGLGLFFCSSVKVSQLTVLRACVGLEIQQCVDLQVNQFSIEETIDNGVYILAGSEGVSLDQGLIRDAEEGIVVLSPHVQMRSIRFLDCTNKAITLRHTESSTVSDCFFQDNAIAIGDDGEGRAVVRCAIRSNQFVNNGLRDIELGTLSDSAIDDNSFYSDGAHDYFVRLGAPARVTISRNTFEDATEKTSTAVMIIGAARTCMISMNRFVSGHTAIRLGESGKSDASSAPTDTSIVLNQISPEFINEVDEKSAVRGTIQVPLK